MANSKRDLVRYTHGRHPAVTQQHIDTQRALVAQQEAQIKDDQAAIDNAQVQLGYTTIRAPITGRIGFRMVDHGNIVHAGDASRRRTIAQIQPIAVIFTAPEEQLPRINEALKAGPLPVIAYTSDGKTELDRGTLALVDNQVDATTGTIRLKGRVPEQGPQAVAGADRGDAPAVERCTTSSSFRTQPCSADPTASSPMSSARTARRRCATSRSAPSTTAAPSSSKASSPASASSPPAIIGCSPASPVEIRAHGDRRRGAPGAMRHATIEAHRAMNISAPFIRHPIATSLIMVGILFVGLVAFPKLPVAPLPQVDFPTIQVSAALPGASPETMASSRRPAARAAVRADPRRLADDLDQRARRDDHRRAVRSRPQHRRRRQRHPGGDQRRRRPAAARIFPSPPTYRKVNPADSPDHDPVGRPPTRCR